MRLVKILLLAVLPFMFTGCVPETSDDAVNEDSTGTRAPADNAGGQGQSGPMVMDTINTTGVPAHESATGDSITNTNAGR